MYAVLLAQALKRALKTDDNLVLPVETQQLYVMVAYLGIPATEAFTVSSCSSVVHGALWAQLARKSCNS